MDSACVSERSTCGYKRAPFVYTRLCKPRDAYAQTHQVPSTTAMKAGDKPRRRPRCNPQYKLWLRGAKRAARGCHAWLWIRKARDANRDAKTPLASLKSCVPPCIVTVKSGQASRSACGVHSVQKGELEISSATPRIHQRLKCRSPGCLPKRRNWDHPARALPKIRHKRASAPLAAGELRHESTTVVVVVGEDRGPYTRRHSTAGIAALGEALVHLRGRCCVAN